MCHNPADNVHGCQLLKVNLVLGHPEREEAHVLASHGSIWTKTSGNQPGAFPDFPTQPTGLRNGKPRDSID